ncbi:MAG: insulinase family protein [Verrucomicrobia bacterium]|nr:MAG: insulinase family protein [Verrucomicrobiota bacterium]
MNAYYPLPFRRDATQFHHIIAALSALAWAILCALPQAFAAEPRKAASVEGITEYQFDNGLRALLFPDKSQSKVTVNLTVLVGSRQEGYGETGMAHLLEHMVFKGTPRHPKIPKVLQEHGAQFNGSTSNDRVNYFETLPATDENLEFALDLEADRLVNSYIKQEDLDSEMTVVRNEFERSENSPGAVLGERIAAAAYDWHNYGKPTIGNRSDIERVPVENLRAFYKKYYQPDNVVLIVAGKFDEPKALALIQKYFGAIPRPERKLVATYTEEPAQDGERSVTLRRVGDVSAVGIAWHIPAASHKDTAALEVLANILRTQPSGRLYKALIETKKAASVSAFARREHDPGLMSVDAEVSSQSTPEEIRDIMLSIVERIGAEGVTVEEVNRARQQILKQRELAANDTAQFGVSMSEWAAEGDWRLYFLHRDYIEQVTPEAVRAAATAYLQRNNRTVGIFIPTEKAQRIAVPPTPDIAALVANYKGREAIAQGEAFEATPENIEARVQRTDLPEGIKVTLLPKKTRGQEAHLLLTLHYGNEDNLKGFQSAASLLPEMMLRGTKKFNHQQLRDELDKLTATLSAGAGGGGRRGGGRRGGPPAEAGPGSVSFSIQAKKQTLPAVIEILGQVLREPALPAEEFDVLKNERLAFLQQMRTEPAMLGPRLLQRELNTYPRDDVRYVTTIDESIERLKDTKYEQVAQLYREYLGSQAGELTIVGDFDSDACLPLLKKALAGWTGSKPYARIAMPSPSDCKAAEHQIKTPDKANATYMAGMLFPLRDDDPDYPALVIGNYIFGAGALSSRLGDRIRQKEGLSYGVSSGLTVSSQDKRAGLTITAICNPQNIGRVEKAAREELERLLRDGVTTEELEKAKQGYLQTRKVGRANDAALAGMLTGLRHIGRTMTFEADVEKSIGALTAEQVQAALRKYIDPAKLVVVTAGDFETKLNEEPKS